MSGEALLLALDAAVAERRAAEAIRDAVAEQVLRTIVDQGGLRVIGVPEAFPSAQEKDAVVLRLEIRVPAALIDAAVAAREGSS